MTWQNLLRQQSSVVYDFKQPPESKRPFGWQVGDLELVIRLKERSQVSRGPLCGKEPWTVDPCAFRLPAAEV